MSWYDVITAVRMGATVLCRNCEGTTNSLSSKPNLYTTNKYKLEKPGISHIHSLNIFKFGTIPGLFIFHVGFYLGGILQIGVLHKCFWVSLSGLTSAGPAYLWSPEYQVAHRLVCCSNTVTREAKPPSLDCAGQFGEILVQCIVSDVILPSYVESFPQESCIAAVNSFLESLCDCPGF